MAWKTIRARQVAVGDTVYSSSKKGPRKITRVLLMPAGRPLLRGPLAFAPADDVALYYWDGPADEMDADHFVRVQAVA